MIFTKNLRKNNEFQGKVLIIKFILEIESLVIIMENGDIFKYQLQKDEVFNRFSIFLKYFLYILDFK